MADHDLYGDDVRGGTGPLAASGRFKEDYSGFILLEDGTSYLILENGGG